VHESQLVALGRGLLFSELEADLLVEGDGRFRVGDANPSVEELDHGRILRGTCRCVKCGVAAECLPE
jgi:hypothetical protein